MRNKLGRRAARQTSSPVLRRTHTREFVRRSFVTTNPEFNRTSGLANS